MCSTCKQSKPGRKVFCEDCHERRLMRFGCISIDPYPRLIFLAEALKRLALKTLDARSDVRSPWFQLEMQIFNYVHESINVHSPSYRHLTPIYEVRGQAKGWHAWEFKILSGECTSELFSRVFREVDEHGSLKLLAHGGAIAIVPSSIFFRIKAENYYVRPFRSLPVVRLTCDTVAIVPTASGQGAEWRWPEDVEYDDDSKSAIKRYLSSTLRTLVDRGQPVHQHVLSTSSRRSAAGAELLGFDTRLPRGRASSQEERREDKPHFRAQTRRDPV